ncbi:unnamed protein product [Paramecium sonneborni]|uniref:Protein kinase domain-containing protein n=1 Tax=Paramecium sonneborni TaxID=65129 RepID=A0A8S1RGP7_9CILI|nr:unnamed protein product [Paramecium sonneborni]CAD8126036.1 unnamed protein product [Paramecium sonneborni]
MQIIDITMGEGSVGIIKQVKIGDEIFALKQFKKKSGEKEYNIHSKLNHENILKFIVGNEEYIISELMLPYDLFEFVKSAGQMSVNASNCILKQLVNALKYMHQLGIVHRDIKLENVLVDGSNYKIKLSDFDASLNIDDGKVPKLIGTSGYLAPEINSIGLIDALNLLECDIHSLGVLYYILLFGTFPFKTTKASCVLYKMIQQNKWEEFWYYSQRNKTKKVPSDCLELIKGMIEQNPQQRFTLDQILDRIGEINEIDYVNEMSKL